MKIENNEETLAIIDRFFEVLDRLKEDGIIRGVQTFTTRYNINRWNLLCMRKEPQLCGGFRVHWLSALVRDYKVNPYFLLLGEGGIYMPGFTPEIIQKLQINCK